jgi:hypothetical protein
MSKQSSTSDKPRIETATIEDLNEITELCAGKPCTDFPKAVEAAHDTYSLEELYAAATPEVVHPGE